MKKYRVCHMTSAHPPEDIRIFHKECVSLAKAGYDVYLVERGESYEKNGVHIVGVGEIPNHRLKRMTRGTKKVLDAALALDCDIYHIHDPELLPYAIKLKRKGKKVIFDSHELTREQIRIRRYLPKIAAELASYAYARYEDRILPMLDAVIFPCPIQGRFPLKGRKQVYINNLPKLDELYDQWDQKVEKLPKSLCTVGMLSPARGIRELILAAHQAGAHLYLGGNFSSADFETEVRNMPEIESAELLGFLDREQVRTLLNRCCVGVSSILNVGQYDQIGNLPTKVYEFMAMGLPVILTRNEFNEGMVRRYRFGVCVDPENIAEFSEVIRDLLEHPDMIQELGENGRKAALEELNWGCEEKKLLELYRSLENGLS